MSLWVLFISTTPDFRNSLKNLMWVLNFFFFYMAIDIAYFLYFFFDDNGANML